MSDKISKTFTDQQHAALNHYINGLRDLIEQAVSLDVPAPVSESLTRQLEQIHQTLQPYSGKKCLPQYNKHFQHEDPNSFLPYSPVSGHFNPIAPPVVYEQQGEKLIGHANLGHAYEGPPQSVHGAVIAGIYDQILAVANTMNKTGGPTAYLNVNYRRPTPLFQPIRFEAWVDKVEGKKVFLKGACYANDELVSDCDALFIIFNPK